jgi:hypothetical protein
MSPEGALSSIAVIAAVLLGIVGYQLVLPHLSPELPVAGFTVISSIIAGGFFLFFGYLSSYGKPNLELLGPFVISVCVFVACMVALVFLHYGWNLAGDYFKTGVLDTTKFLTWLAILLVPPFGLWLFVNVKSFLHIYQDSKLLSLQVAITSDARLPIYVTDLRFIDSATQKESVFAADKAQKDRNGHSRARDNDEPPKNIAEANDRLSVTLAYENVIVPRGADQFVLSWYSFLEDKHYRDTFPIRRARFTTKKVRPEQDYGLDPFYRISKSTWQKLCPFLIQDELNAINLRIKYQGEVDLFIKHKHHSELAFFYTKVLTDDIPPTTVESLKTEYFGNAAWKPSHAMETIDALVRQAAMAKRLFNWNIEIEDMNANGYLSVDDLAHANVWTNHSGMMTFHKRPLPIKIELYKEIQGQGSDITFQLEPEILFAKLAPLGEDEAITFQIKAPDINSVTLSVKTASGELDFTDWQMELRVR